MICLVVGPLDSAKNVERLRKKKQNWLFLNFLVSGQKFSTHSVKEDFKGNRLDKTR